MNINKVKIGMRVRFAGNDVIGPCSGVVEKIYYPDHATDDPEAHYPGSVSMRPDALPEPWPYAGYYTFAPWVGNIEPDSK